MSQLAAGCDDPTRYGLEPGKTRMPFYFRKCYNESFDTARVREEVKRKFGKGMINNLVLDTTAEEAGVGMYKDRFLCHWIKDEDLPWDQSETDW